MKKIFTTVIGFIMSLSVWALPQENLANYRPRLDKQMIERQLQKQYSDDISLDDIITEASSHLGKRYVWATRGPKTFDCSGFVYYVYKQFGMTLNPSSRNQYKLGVEIPKEEAQKGDLIFFHSKSHPRGVGHVGIVYEVGEDGIKFIHASVKKGVTISELEGYYERNYVGIRRVIH